MSEPPRAQAQRDAAARLPGLMSAVRGAPGDRAAAIAYWRAFFELPMWLMIARGPQDAPSPFVIVPQDRPTLLVFSDPDGARQTGIAAGLPEPEASLVLAVPQPSAADWVLQFAEKGVQAVQFDAHLEGGFLVPMPNLAAINADMRRLREG